MRETRESLERFNNAIEGILDRLLKGEKRRLSTKIHELSQMNSMKLGITPSIQDLGRGFRYLDEVFVVIGSKGGNLPSLHFDLRNEGDELIRDRDKFYNDRQMIRQLLVKLLYSCETIQHVRDSLPDCLLQYGPEDLRTLPRIDSVESRIGSDTRLLNQYQKILPKIEIYSVSGLLY
jgi:hypothetical protein